MKKKIIIAVSLIIVLVIAAVVVNGVLCFKQTQFNINNLQKTKNISPFKFDHNDFCIFPNPEVVTEEENFYRYGIMRAVTHAKLKVDDITIDAFSIESNKSLTIGYDNYSVIVYKHYLNWKYYYCFKGNTFAEINKALDALSVRIGVIQMIVDGKEVHIGYNYSDSDKVITENLSYSIEGELGVRCYYYDEEITETQKEKIESEFFLK